MAAHERCYRVYLIRKQIPLNSAFGNHLPPACFSLDVAASQEVTRKVRKLDLFGKRRVRQRRQGSGIIDQQMPRALDPFRFVVIAVAGWMNQHQLQIIDYLREENRVLREQLGGRRVRFNDDQRRRLAETTQGCSEAVQCHRPPFMYLISKQRNSVDFRHSVKTVGSPGRRMDIELRLAAPPPENYGATATW